MMGTQAIYERITGIVIAVGGGFGTLSEIAHALNLGRTVVGLDTWKLERAYEKPIPGLVEAETPKEAVGMAMEAILAKN